MKKKVLYGVALALISSVAMGTLQSCKDDVSDLNHQLNYDRTQLQGQITALRADLDECKSKCQSEIDALKARVSTNEGDIAQLRTDLSALEDKVAQLVTAEQLQQALDALENEMKGYTDQQIADAVAVVNARIDAVEDAFNTKLGQLGDQINEIENKYAELATTVEQQAATIEAMQATLADLQTHVENNKKEIDKLVDKYLEMQQEMDKIWSEFDLVYQDIQTLAESLSQYMRLTDERLDALEKAVEKLNQRFDKLITGIIVQGTDSPVFGTFNLPIGVQSNLLFNWYGEYTANEPMEFAGDENGNVKQFNRGSSGPVNLGNLYLTINPINHEFENVNLTLVTSAGNVFPVGLEANPSDDELMFGYSRAVNEGNGFYKVPVVLPNTLVAENIALTVDQELKDAMKELVKDPNRRTPTELLKALYNQFNNKVPAYAVRYDWTVDEEDEDGNVTSDEYAVISKYEIAATTAKALSYNFLKGQGSDKKLPLFGNIDNFLARLKEKVMNKFNLGVNIEVDGKAIALDSVEFKDVEEPIFEGSDIMVTSLYAYVEGLTVDGNAVEVEPIRIDNAEKAASEVTLGIQKAIGYELGAIVRNDRAAGGYFTENEALWAQITSKVDLVLLEMQNQIAQVIDEVKGEANSAFESIDNKFGGFFDRVNKAFDLYNKVASKINNFLANPNAYLQVAAFYEMKGGVGVVSGVANDPTVFNAGNGAIDLFLSSYTGELVVPAFKKYIECEALGISEVLDGNEIKYQVPASDLTPGTVYEFKYQGLDYSGYVSTRKFYITVK